MGKSLDNQCFVHVKYNFGKITFLSRSNYQVGEISPQRGVSKIIFSWDESHLTINVFHTRNIILGKSLFNLDQITKSLKKFMEVHVCVKLSHVV
jgi:hypothetical protein